ncbi:30S ribosomal protein S20, chloroplastic [Solanum dulcamara]|uniref:30S ribosomal protein S20, chloroplastic n=1 Tax=Solanum dulcamara TaxID=45834 RepID=UPI0024864E00|nr:30S ribosomal protein S20, chloroplastic [Solanum dulcamara]
MAGACLSSSCWSFTTKFNTLSLNGPHPNADALRSLSFSANTSLNLFSKGTVSLNPVQMPFRRSIVCEAAPTKKADSAAKRARQAEKRRVYHKAKKSEVKTRMKTVLEALETLKKKPDAQSEEVVSVEKLIAEAYSAIDKAVKVGTLHRNTGARRKSRLARRKKAVEIHHGWYVPAPATEPDLVATA